MEFLNRTRFWVILGSILGGAFLLYQLWVWEVERVEVKPDEFLVKINLWGKNLPEGEILAPDESYKGVQREVLAEGRHFLNPLVYSYERHKVVRVNPGECAVLTRKSGKEISPERLARGEFLARGDFEERDPDRKERGILEKVLEPGKYRLNPYEYKHEIVKAVEIKAHQVGVRTLKWGKDPRTLKARTTSYVVPPGYRGVQAKHVPSGTYYINPYVEAITPVDIRSHPVEFTDIEFPSLDGFTIRPHVLVAYEVKPEKAPELFVQLCDHGVLSQTDATTEQQKKNPILQKFVLPLIRGYVRIEGSKHPARDYVSQQKEEAVNPREKLQQELLKRVVPSCEKVGVLITSITVTQPEMNDDLKTLADTIAQRENTRVERERNKEKVARYTKEQEQKAKEAEREQKQKVVDATSKFKVEEVRVDQRKENEEARLENDLKAAQAKLDAAKEQAKAIEAKGKAEAAIIKAQNKAEVAGLEKAIAGFPSAEQFAQYHVVSRMTPSLTEIFAGDQSEFAKMFTAYLNGTKKTTPDTKAVKK